jgi:hypothetical protein
VSDLSIALSPPREPPSGVNQNAINNSVEDRPDSDEVGRVVSAAIGRFLRGESSKETFLEDVKIELTRCLGRPATNEDVKAELEKMCDEVIRSLGPGAQDNSYQRALEKLEPLPLW